MRYNYNAICVITIMHSPYRRFNTTISPIHYHHIADLISTYSRFTTIKSIIGHKKIPNLNIRFKLGTM
jgi:hypothetical protein